MERTRLDRRTFLAAAGGGLLASIAGCAEPRAGTEVSFEGTDSRPDVESDRADGSVYTSVYDRTIDSVTLVRVYGVDDPLTGDERQGQGSAFLVDERYAVTNEHVVAGGEEVDLQYVNGDWTATELLGTDFYSDLAVLEIDHAPESADPLALTDLSPTVGQEVLAIGNPLGLEGSMTKGIVSGVDRSLEVAGRSGEPRSFPNVVQFDAGVNPGNSGGPLVDMDGEVVGVVNAGGGDNIGFAISAALTSRVVPALIEDGEYHHPFLGVVLQTVDRIVAEENDLSEPGGVIVADVSDDSPSADVLRGSDDEVDRHGERIPVGGDVILELDGHPTPDRNTLSAALTLETSPGDTVPIEIRRDGERRTVSVTLGERPTPN